MFGLACSMFGLKIWESCSMCSMFGVLMFEVFDVRYFGVRSKTNKSWRVAQVLRFGQSVGGLVEHKEFVLSSRFANSKLLLLFLLPLPASTKHNSKRDAEQRRGKPSRRPCCSPWLGCKINCPQFSPPLAVWSIFSWVSSKMKSWEMDHWCSS